MRHQQPSLKFLGATVTDPDASDGLRTRIKRELDWRPGVPGHLETIDVEDPR